MSSHNLQKAFCKIFFLKVHTDSHENEFKIFNDLVDRIVNSLNMLQFSGHVPKNTRMYTLSLYYIWYVTSETLHVLLSVVVEYSQLFQTDLFHIVSGGCPIQQSLKN